jgi:hypothetical protein
MTRLFWLLAALAVAPAAAQQESAFPPDIFDTRPVALDPTHFRLILENDRVQVIRVRLGPGEKTMIMDIPAHVMTCLTDQHVRIIHAHDKPAERRHKTGDSLWVDKNEYGLENLGEKLTEWILVVPKSNGK